MIYSSANLFVVCSPWEAQQNWENRLVRNILIQDMQSKDMFRRLWWWMETCFDLRNSVKAENSLRNSGKHWCFIYFFSNMNVKRTADAGKEWMSNLWMTSGISMFFLICIPLVWDRNASFLTNEFSTRWFFFSHHPAINDANLPGFMDS